MKNLAAMPSDKIVDIGGVKLYLPDYSQDLIQSEIVDRGTFYESDQLQIMSSYIKKDAVILDIGANIGNHSVYWATHNRAKKVYAFEPVRRTFEILQKNIQINRLETKIQPFNIGLSDKKVNASILRYDGMNIGGTTIIPDSGGDLLLEKLDDIKFDEDTIDFVKIDVEGHELQVLHGARETLIKYKPVIFIETFPDKAKKVDEFLSGLGYYRAQTLDGDNFIYISKKT